ncbi:putative short chain dehydrogenase protein [Phaeoacremonium minimum UCRPA7]|uniref:Putative short chain dehydrogenase protein n=1 Tax=Phaeoacremonium minimum (strain UCR-PA7) TaxID=1286976 RepID=R8BUB8_PHAM7|nr:putative short chain dehydrogenase protein [Phaeoacremonium minimum UCRPA7]EOO02875.1 putative short chain dehydrogenase protein [Phaeoacremonium minimum UCRPA7]
MGRMADHWRESREVLRLRPGGGYNVLFALVAVLGLVTALKILFNILSFVYLYLLRRSSLGRYLHSTDGKPAWALVTGASDGLGRQFAHELAARGFNVVVHGRNPAKLEAVRDELAIAFPGRSFRVLVADISAIPCHRCQPAASTTPSATESTQTVDLGAIVASLSDINLTVLINNAGGGVLNSSGQPTFHPLQAFPQSTVLGNVNVNAIFPLLLLHKLIPQLIRNAPSLAINIGSMADQGMPLLSFYGPSKTFAMGVAGSLALEMILEGQDVEVLGVRLGEVTGVSHYKAAPTIFGPSAQTMARAALERVGCGRPTVIGYWAHALQQAGANLLPDFLKDRILLDIMSRRREDERRKLKSA